jgi:hypothetical protein
MVVPAGSVEKFPPIDKLIPTGPGTMPPAGYVVNPRYLASFADIQDAVGGDANHGIRLTMWGASVDGQMHEPLLFDGYGGTRYVIMPMRDSFRESD